VSEPNIIALLSGKRDNSNTSNDSSNNYDCEQSSSYYIRHSGRQLNNSASVISVANSAVINYSSGKRFQIASVSGFVAKSLIASSNQSSDSGNRETVQRRELASKNGVTSISSASQSINASDVFVNTTNLRVARIFGAVAVVVTITGIKSRIVAPSLDVAEIKCAKVAIVASLSSVDAHSSGSIAGIGSASVSIVTVLGSCNAGSLSVIALVFHAIDGRASDVETSVASNGGMIAPIVGCSRMACVIGARIEIFARSNGESTSTGRVASRYLAVVCRGADSRSISLASFGRDTVVISAKVSIVANGGGVRTSVSILSSSASSHFTLVTSVASGGADTSGSTRAKTVATSSTRVTRNVNASGLNKGVQNAGEGTEAWNVGVSSSDSWNSGGDGYQFVRVDTISYSESEQDNSGIVSGIDDISELIGVHVVLSISKNDHDRRYVSSNLVQVGLCGLNSTSNASVSSFLVHD